MSKFSRKLVRRWRLYSARGKSGGANISPVFLGGLHNRRNDRRSRVLKAESSIVAVGRVRITPFHSISLYPARRIFSKAYAFRVITTPEKIPSLSTSFFLS